MRITRTFRVKIGRVREKKRWRPKVTDHALIRYIERKYQIDMDDIRADFDIAPIKQAIRAGAPMVAFGGLRFVLRGAKVITVLDGVKTARDKRGDKALTRKQREILEGADDDA